MNEIREEINLIIGRSLLNYERISSQPPMMTFIPCSEDEIIREYQNNAIFHSTVRALRAKLVPLMEKGKCEHDFESDGGKCIKCGKRAFDTFRSQIQQDIEQSEETYKQLLLEEKYCEHEVPLGWCSKHFRGCDKCETEELSENPHLHKPMVLNNMAGDRARELQRAKASAFQEGQQSMPQWVEDNGESALHNELVIVETHHNSGIELQEPNTLLIGSFKSDGFYLLNGLRYTYGNRIIFRWQYYDCQRSTPQWARVEDRATELCKQGYEIHIYRTPEIVWYVVIRKDGEVLKWVVGDDFIGRLTHAMDTLPNPLEEK